MTLATFPSMAVLLLAGLLHLLPADRVARTSAVVATGGYLLPFPKGLALWATQGNNEGDHRPSNQSTFAFDFADTATHSSFKVAASRAGTVRGVRADSGVACDSSSCWAQANFVVIDHGDGTSALYLHLQQGQVFVQQGQQVRQGQIIADADSTGWSTGTHLHMQVEATPCSDGDAAKVAACEKRPGWWWTASKQFAFADADVLNRHPDGIPQSDAQCNPSGDRANVDCNKYSSDNSTPPASPTSAACPSRTQFADSIRAEFPQFVRVEVDQVFCFNTQAVSLIMGIDASGRSSDEAFAVLKRTNGRWVFDTIGTYFDPGDPACANKDKLPPAYQGYCG